MNKTPDSFWRTSRAIHCFGITAMVMLVLAVHLAIVSPLRARAESEARLRVQLTDQQNRNARLEQSRKQLDAQIKSTELELASGSFELLSPKKINSKLAQLADLASRTGLQIEGMDPGPLNQASSLATQSIRITGRGSFKSCHAFMRSLRQDSPDTGVYTFSLVANDGGASPTLTFDINLIWCAQNEHSTTDIRN